MKQKSKKINLFKEPKMLSTAEKWSLVEALKDFHYFEHDFYVFSSLNNLEIFGELDPELYDEDVITPDKFLSIQLVDDYIANCVWYCDKNSIAYNDAIYYTDCKDCGKNVYVERLDDGHFVPHSVNGCSIMFTLEEDIIYMFCTEEDLGEKTNFIYLISDHDRNFLKIGISNNPHKRKKSIQTGNPSALKILYAFPGELSDESEAKNRFINLKALRGNGNEWYHFNDEIIKYFQERSPFSYFGGINDI